MRQWDVWLTRTNIADFKRKIETETDPHKRRVLQELLAREEAKLGAQD